MSIIDLNGLWKLRDTKDSKWLSTAVPGTVFSTLLDNKLAPDPYYRDNEDKVQKFFTNDYEYKREFHISQSDLDSDRLMLVCEGIDTLADVYINNTKIAKAENMHRTYKFEISDYLQTGINEIRIIIYSAKNFLAESAKDSPLPSVLGVTGVEHLRKAQCQFGWDWGLCLPDMGIWRSIYIECNNIGKIEDLYFSQKHNENSVKLEYDAVLSCWTGDALSLKLTVEEPGGRTFYKTIEIKTDKEKLFETEKENNNDHDKKKCKTKVPHTEKAHDFIEIPEPKLWWPSGYGDQSLYHLTLSLIKGRRIIDTREMNIGLRTIKLRRDLDEFGQSYEFIINGKPIFLKGSNLIIEDAILTRRSYERTEKMLKACIKANFNCVRVWGGGIYPEDYFYDICDKLGLLVYQDFMFSCHIYPATDEFIENISCEIEDNVRRIRHHACLALWSGNNEIETIIGLYLGTDEALAPMAEGIRQYFGFEKPDEALEAKIKNDYLKIFTLTIPDLLETLDPSTEYTRSSPCIKDEPFSSLLKGLSNGDSHFYVYAMGMMDYKNQRNFYFRFVSEIGFQSYPCLKTIKTFASENDLGPYTPIMLKHQKAVNGNQTIETYMGREFNIPADFTLYIYASQVTAGEVQSYIAKHLRRHRGRCMGIITWQLNDCWSAVSWAGLDYHGRWKAQQYYTKRFFAPVLLSCNESIVKKDVTGEPSLFNVDSLLQSNNDIGAKADIYITNDTRETVNGTIKWALKDNFSKIIINGSREISVDPLNAMNCVSLDFEELNCGFDPNEQYLEYSLESAGNLIAFDTTIFVAAKEFKFIDPLINYVVEEANDTFKIILESKAYARAVALDLSTDDCVFSDNFFDMSANTKKEITVEKSEMSKVLSQDELKQQINLLSLYDLQSV